MRELTHTPEQDKSAERYDNCRLELQSLINRNSAENGSNTPDFILAEFLTASLKAFDAAVRHRSRWHGNTEQLAWEEGKPAAPVNAWQPIDLEAAKSGEVFVVCLPRQGRTKFTVHYSELQGCFMSKGEAVSLFEGDLWMPLPA